MECLGEPEEEPDGQLSPGQGRWLISTYSGIGLPLGTCILANFNLISVLPQYVFTKLTVP